jgi:hypothetical protein
MNDKATNIANSVVRAARIVAVDAQVGMLASLHAAGELARKNAPAVKPPTRTETRTGGASAAHALTREEVAA